MAEEELDVGKLIRNQKAIEKAWIERTHDMSNWLQWKAVDCESSPKLLALILTRLVAGAQTLLDVGCYDANPTKHLPVPHKAYVDLEDRGLPNFVQGDIRHLEELVQGPFDIAIATDVIEHLTTPEGHALLASMRRLARTVIIETPLGALAVDDTQTGPHTHKSWWMPRDLGPDYSGVIVPTPADRPSLGWWVGWRGVGPELLAELPAYTGPMSPSWDMIWRLS